MAKDAWADNRRAFGPRGLAELVPGVTRAAYRKKSPAGALLMSEWALIVGPRLAAETQPRRLTGMQLTIACSGPMAMELQHVSASLIERINAHVGRALVDRLRFVQDMVAERVPVVRRVRPGGMDKPVEEGVEVGELSEALGRLRVAMGG